MFIAHFLVAVERMAVVTSSATAWETVQGTTEDGTTLSDAENRLPECAEKLMSIISSITGAYCVKVVYSSCIDLYPLLL